MQKYVNGKYIALTTGEVAAMQDAAEREAAAERKRPLTEQEVSRMLLAQQVNTLAVDDNTALRMKDFYPVWTVGESYAVGYKVQKGGRLWKVAQAHTAQTGWEPENAASLWTEICETHSGKQDDPISYNGNMELTDGLYYWQDDTLYRCIRSTGTPVYHALRELVGLYVVTVKPNNV